MRFPSKSSTAFARWEGNMIATTVYLNRSFPTFWSDANETYDSDARLMATRACPLTALISDLKYIPTDVRALLMTSVSSRETLAHGEGVRLIEYFIINCNSHLTLQLFTTTCNLWKQASVKLCFTGELFALFNLWQAKKWQANKFKQYCTYWCYSMLNKEPLLFEWGI